MSERARVATAGQAVGVAADRIRFYAREHERLHAALLEVIVGGKPVKEVARARRVDRGSLAGHVGRVRRMLEGERNGK